MRNIILTALVTFVLACPSRVCFAQTASPDKAAAPQPLTGEGGSDTRGADAGASNVLKNFPVSGSPKAAIAPRNEQAARPGDVGRVGTLSPDEERRAARARARATQAQAPAHNATRAENQAAGIPIATGAEHHAADIPSAPQRGRAAPVVSKTVAVNAQAPVADRVNLPTVVSRDQSQRLILMQRRRIAALVSARRARREARARSSARMLAADTGRPPRVGDVVPGYAQLAPVPPRYGNVVSGLEERRSVADMRGPAFGGGAPAPRGPYPYPQAGWYQPPAPPFGYPGPRYGF